MNHLQVYDPFAGTNLDELVRGLFQPVRMEKGTPGAAAAIRMDVAERDKAYVVRAELPGVNKEEVQVTIEGNQVTISAEVKRETESREGERVLRSERHYGAFYRSFVLPAEIDEAASEAKYLNGVLELVLPKKQAAAGRKLSIQ